MEVNIQDVVYEGVWHHQTLVRDFEMPNTRGDSLSSSLAESPESPRVTLEIDERLLAPQRSSELTKRFNEAYDEDAQREDEEFFRNTRKYYRRRFSAED